MKYTDFYDSNFLNNFDIQQYNNLKALDLDISNSLKVDVYHIIRACGIEFSIESVLENNHLKDKSGYYENGVIHINSGEKEQRQRFTAAHELGHAILNNNQSGVLNRFIDKDNYSRINDQIDERNANKFAANLLMPKKLVDFAVNESEYSDKKLVDEISKKMGLSKSAVNYRLYNLNYVESLYYK